MDEAEELEIGMTAPGFCLPNQDGRDACLEDFSESWVVLYFYPKDNTRGYIMEAIDFTMSLGDFEALGTAVIGVSPDSTKSHKDFCKKHGLTLTLLSDPEHEVSEKYGVWQVKKIYGKESAGIVRTTFLIDPKGKVAHVWRKVKVDGHIDAVKKKLTELKEKN